MTRPAASGAPIRAHTLMGGGPLMTAESTVGARAALAAFPGIAGVTVTGPDAGQAGRCRIGRVVPSGPGLDVPGPHARKPLGDGSMPAAVMVAGENPVAARTVNAAALPSARPDGWRAGITGKGDDRK